MKYARALSRVLELKHNIFKDIEFEMDNKALKAKWPRYAYL